MQCRFEKRFFTRSRLLPFTVLVSYIVNLIRRSLQFELSSFAGFLNFPDVSKQAFSQARIKLSPLVFQLLNKKLLVEFYSDNEIKLFKGLRLLSVDGSTIRLPASDELFQAFKPHCKDNKVPVALTSVIYDVLNHMTLHATLTSYRDASEKSMACEHFTALQVLVTSLIDQNEFIYEDIFKLYGLRWNIEEHYKFYKCIAEIENFSGESKIAVEKDFYATVFTCNSASLLAQEAQEEVNQASTNKPTKYTYKINRNILIGTIKNEILEVLLGNQDLAKYCENLKRRLKRSLVAIRPSRSFDRPESRRERRPIIHKNAL